MYVKAIFQEISEIKNELQNQHPVNQNMSLNGIDRLCKVVELSMQCCGKLHSDSFETY